jgi:hypothetical protein
MAHTRLVCLFIGILLIGSVLFPAPASAGVGATPATLNFGSVTVNTNSGTATIVVTNYSRQIATIAQVSSSLPEFVVVTPAMPISLGFRASASIQVMFKPDSALTFNGSIIIIPGRKGGSSISVGVSGTGTPAYSAPPQTFLLSQSASSLNFGSQLVGSSASQSFTLTNTGTGSVNLSQVTATGAGFTVTGFSGAVTLAAGQSLPLSVNFTPASAGGAAGSISVVSNATNSPSTITLSGTGVQAQISVVPSTVSFGNVTVGVSNSQTLTIRNPGTAALSVTQASLSGTGFTSTGLALPLSIPAGGSSTFNVAFAPTSAGAASGSITLISNTPNSPLVVPFTGTGIAATLQLSASSASLNFGSLTTGTSATQSFTVTNTGNSSVSISQVSESGAGFSVNGIALPLSLAAGQSTSFTVMFAPASAVSLSGSVTVVSNATNSPLVIALSGTGASSVSHTVALSWTPSSSTYSGFNVYRGATSGGPYTRVDTTMVSSTSYLDAGVSSGQTYYYVATELDSTGMESSYSSEVSAVIP